MTYFDNCCHGGTRQKATGWWANVDWFTGLAARCDGSHFHEKWNAEIIGGQVLFPTHLEAAYPILLCQRLASIAQLKALEFGATEVHTLEQQVEHAPSSQQCFLLDMLPRGRKSKPLVSEYGHYQQWAIALPVRAFKRGCFRVDESSDTNIKAHPSRKSDHEHEVVTVGIPREPLEFLGHAIEAGHSRSVAIHLSDAVREFCWQRDELAKKRAEFLWKWSNRAKELNKKEVELHKKLPAHLQHLLRGKRLLLLREVP